VYQAESTRQLLRGPRLLRRGKRWPRVSRNVVLLGLVSLFTDLSSEMVATILPLYLIFGLGLSPFQFGVVDGIYQGASGLVRVGGGFAGDRWRKHKEVAGMGYGLSAVCKLGYVAVGSALSSLSAIVLLDRIGKGIRTAPRDALISLSTSRATLGTAFGVHRALDTAGAMLGPLAAFTILAIAPRAFDAVFVVSFCVALIGVSLLFLFVENRSPGDQPAPAAALEGPVEDKNVTDRVSLRDALGLLAVRRFQMLVVLGTLLALFTVSDGFLYLAMQNHLHFDEHYLPLLYTGSALAYMLLAVPLGRLADRIGPGRVFLAGYAVLLPVYGTLLLPGLGMAALPIYLLLVGTYYAATDGVLMALASSMLPEDLLGSGLALLVTATSLARLLASVMLGAIWTWAGLDAALLAFGVGLGCAMLLAGLLLMRMREQPAHA
jgi:MFS family permease